MKANQKGLQRLTESETKVNEILSLERITPSDTKQLNKIEIEKLNEILSEKLRSLNGEARDKFLRKIDLLIDDTTKNQFWESNHHQITWAISSLLLEYKRMPTITEIANKSELSRQTIHKHLKDYTNHPLYMQQIEQFRFMTQKVLTKVYSCAEHGDIAAAKLYFNVIGNLNGQLSNNTVIQNQNNYIQINGMILSQETIKRLNPEQLNNIESILKAALPQPEKQ